LNGPLKNVNIMWQWLCFTIFFTFQELLFRVGRVQPTCPITFYAWGAQDNITKCHTGRPKRVTYIWMVPKHNYLILHITGLTVSGAVPFPAAWMYYYSKPKRGTKPPDLSKISIDTSANPTTRCEFHQRYMSSFRTDLQLSYLCTA